MSVTSEGFSDLAHGFPPRPPVLWPPELAYIRALRLCTAGPAPPAVPIAAACHPCHGCGDCHASCTPFQDTMASEVTLGFLKAKTSCSGI